MTNLGNVNLGELVPAKARRPIYAGFALVGIGIGATQVGFAAADAGQPLALTVALAVYAFLSVPIGTLAAINTPKA